MSFPRDTVFGNEYWHWRENGLSHFESLNKARDYYRKYTAREVLPEDGFMESIEDEAATLPQIVDLRNAFDKVLTRGTNMEVKLFCGILRMQNMDMLLSDSQQLYVESLMAGSAIGTQYELAQWMGYKVRPNGSCSALSHRKWDLGSLLSRLGLINRNWDSAEGWVPTE